MRNQQSANDLTRLLFPPTRQRRYIMHLAFWLFFIAFHLIYFIPLSFQMPITYTMLMAYVLYYIRIVPVFYASMSAHRWFSKGLGSFGAIASAFLSSVAIMHTATVAMFLLTDLIFGLGQTAPSFKMLGDLYLGTFENPRAKDLMLLIFDIQDLQLLILPLGIQMVKSGILHERKRREMEHDQLRRDIRHLRTQLSPHLVLNLLNTAFAEILPISEKTASYLAGMAHVIRFALHRGNKNMVAVQDEISCMQQLLYIEQARMVERSIISCTVTGTIQSAQTIPGLLLISLAENALKHGVHASSAQSFIHIIINIEADTLVFTITNSVPTAPISPKTSFSGIGLRNITRRLKLQYGNNYELRIQQGRQTFSVHLRLPLTGYEIPSVRP